MKSSHATFFGLIVIVGLLTFFFVTSRDPELRYVGSTDGVVTVSGRIRNTQDFLVTEETSIARGAPLVSMAYRIDPAHAVLDAPVVLTFRKTPDAGTQSASTVYRWNAALGMWESVTTGVASTSDVLGVSVSSLGIFAAGDAPQVAMPTMLTLYDDLRAKAPRGTRGYRTAVSYTLPGGVPVRVQTVGEIGGCGGRVDAGERTEYSSVAAEVMILVDDVLTPVTITAVSEWAVNDRGDGCAETSPLAAQGT